MSESDPESGEASERDHGSQPLDRILDELGISNRDLVAASTRQLTHKQVRKARRGRHVTANIQEKIREALEVAAAERGRAAPVARGDLFDYLP